MKKICSVLVVLLIGILALGIYINSKIGNIQELSAIYNAKSSTTLYVLEQNKTVIAKKILLGDIIQLIYAYDKNTYEKSRIVKSTLCKDIPNYHMDTIKEYFTGANYQSKEELKYKKQIFHNLELIKHDFCVDYIEHN
jgi:hypothetical protein